MRDKVRHNLELFILCKLVVSVAFMLRSRLADHRKQFDFFLKFAVKFEINEQLVVFDVFEFKQMYVVLLLAVYLTVTVVSDYSLIQTTGSDWVLTDHITHRVVCKLAKCCLGFTEVIFLPRLVEQELFYTQDGTFLVGYIWIVTDRCDFSTRYHNNRSFVGVGSDDAFTRFHLNVLHHIDDVLFVSLVDALQKRSDRWVLKVEVTKLFGHLAIRNQLDNRVLFHPMYIVVESLHWVVGSQPHEFKHL
jgi:hypothetical protein